MSTENGLEKIATARRKIESLRRRHEWIVGQIDAMTAAGAGMHTGYLWAERTALEWALPILEVEWDNLARIRREAAATAGPGFVP